MLQGQPRGRSPRSNKGSRREPSHRHALHQFANRPSSGLRATAEQACLRIHTGWLAMPTAFIRGQRRVGGSSDVVICRQILGQIAEELKFSATGRTMLVTAASELARNALLHGGGGEVFCGQCSVRATVQGCDWYFRPRTWHSRSKAGTDQRLDFRWGTGIGTFRGNALALIAGHAATSLRDRSELPNPYARAFIAPLSWQLLVV